MKQNILRVFPVVATFLLFAGGAYALNEHSLSSLLGVASGDTEALDYDGTVKMNSAYIGDQDTGGVTFFNGTVINATTDDDGNENPVTFGDDVRIDGEIFRTERNGDNAVKIDDDLEVDGDVTADNLYTTSDLYTQTESDAAYVSQTTPTWDAQTSYFAIPPSAFVPSTETLDHVNIGLLYPNSSGIFSAPLLLPHGSVVTGFSYEGWDNSSGYMRVSLLHSADNLVTALALHETVGATAGVQTFTDNDFESFTVDNSSGFYYVSIFFDAAGGADVLELDGVTVAYTWSGPGTSVSSTGVPVHVGEVITSGPEISVE